MLYVLQWHHVGTRRKRLADFDERGPQGFEIRDELSRGARWRIGFDIPGYRRLRVHARENPRVAVLGEECGDPDRTRRGTVVHVGDSHGGKRWACHERLDGSN